MKFSDLNLKRFGHEVQLASAGYADGDKLINLNFPDEPKREIIDVFLSDSDWAALLAQVDSMPVEVREARNSLDKIVMRKCERHVDAETNWRVFRRDNFKCRYCGTDKVSMTVDHAICWEALGPSTEENLVTCCKKDNRTRGNMPYKEWIVSPEYLKKAVGLSAMTRQLNMELAERLDQIPLRQTARSR